MELFFDLQLTSVLFLLFVGFVGGLVSGFIGAGGAFLFTPAMMSLGIPAIVAVASNLCYMFPKALQGGLKRIKYGQVDVKLGAIMGLSAVVGVISGAIIQMEIKHALGNAGSNVYVSSVFVVILAILGAYALKSAWKLYKLPGRQDDKEHPINKLSLWVQSIHIPGTMVYFRSIDTKISILFVLPLGFAVGLLAGTIALSGFVGVTVTMYLLGVPGLMASATELMIAFAMGIGGTIIYALNGFVDISLAMIILAGSLFGVQLGVVSTTYAKDYMVKIVMGVLMILITLSLCFKLPVYISDMGYTLSESTVTILNYTSFTILLVALVTGTIIILYTFFQGRRQSAKALALAKDEQAIAPISEPEYFPTSAKQLSPTGRFEKIMLVTDNSGFSAAATREGIRLAQRTEGYLSVMSVVVTNSEHESLARELIEKENHEAIFDLETVKNLANEAGVDCNVHLRRGIEIYQEIVDEAEVNRVDLIVMGRRDYTGFMRVIMRSSTAKVIGYAHCSVLVVPKTAKIEGKKILLAVDGTRYSDTAASTVMSLAKHIHSSVLVISITAIAHEEKRHQDSLKEVKRIESFLSQEGIDVEGKVLSGNPADTILEFAKAKNVDLIVMGSHGHTGLNKMLLGSVSDRVIASSECATLVVKAA